MIGIDFRPATPADWLEIEDLLMRHHLPSAGAKEHLQHFLVGRNAAGILAGVAGMEYYGEVALLRSVAVAWRKRGVGTDLVRRILNQAAKDGIQQVALLTTTAADYFPRFGFRVVNRAELPVALQASAEFQGACPDTAVAMVLDLKH
jgi:amino-acid N-acetyltransferase